MVTGVLGSKLFISSVAVTSATDTEGEYTALTWTEVGLISNFGDFGRVFDTVPFQAVATGRTSKLKGAFNDGQIQISVGQDLTDAGQAAVQSAAVAATQDNWGFRIELGDPPNTIGGPTTYFFRGLPMSFKTTMGAVNSVLQAQAMIEVNSDITHLPAAEWYDRFPTGESLSPYALFAGSDAQAALPIVSANTLVAVTGNDGSGYAADGSQAIGTTGFTLSGGPVTFEVRVKISAITNVALFVGLTDQVAALEAPIEASGSSNAITTNATDAVGFMFDTSMSTDNIWLVGVNNNVDETTQNTAVALVADTYKTLRIEIAANGDAVFKMDGAVVGTTMTTACRTSVALYPTIVASARSTASRTATADYLYVRQD